ncbi:MAG: N-acetylmuramoyl-L-alanine amidase [Anaerolineae bacterium]|nr:N-acetylmuramoyl-L-alanine amidase [Anaerolineae bacterium]
MPDDDYPPPSSARPDAGRPRRPPFEGFSRDEFRFHSFDDRADRAADSPGADDDAPPDEPLVYDDEADADGDDQEDGAPDVFLAVTVDGQTLKASAAPPVTLAPRRAGSHARARQRQRPPSPAARTGLQMVRTILLALAAAILVSTIFSLWTRPTFLPDNFRAGLNQVQATQHLFNIQPSPLPTDIPDIKIGIVAGHSGPPQDETFSEDPGAVCPDGLTELSINTGVARQAVAALQRDGYEVDLLEEFDPRLKNYRANALVSIHTNDCSNYGAVATGYNAASAASRQTTRGADERLLDCLISQYGATTGLPRHYGITVDMTAYHTFSEVSSDTPTVIIELGYMLNDRAILTTQQDLLAQGVANGVRCFLRPEIYGRPPSSAQ